MRDAIGALDRAPDQVTIASDGSKSVSGGEPSANGWTGAPDDQTDPSWAPGQTAAQGDTATRVARLYRELFPSVFGFIRFRVGDGHLAEDLTATVFERALARLATVRDPDRVRSWLFTVARNVVTDERRRRRPGGTVEEIETLEHLWVDSPESEALARDEWRRLVGYLADLDDRDREILGLRFAAGLSNREVGQVVGHSEAHVAQIIHRAVVKLRRRFANEETA
jgi:RNA polymerase sigma factor (sigma-70 family)